MSEFSEFDQLKSCLGVLKSELVCQGFVVDEITASLTNGPFDPAALPNNRARNLFLYADLFWNTYVMNIRKHGEKNVNRFGLLLSRLDQESWVRDGWSTEILDLIQRETKQLAPALAPGSGSPVDDAEKSDANAASNGALSELKASADPWDEVNVRFSKAVPAIDHIPLLVWMLLNTNHPDRPDESIQSHRRCAFLDLCVMDRFVTGKSSTGELRVDGEMSVVSDAAPDASPDASSRTPCMMARDDHPYIGLTAARSRWMGETVLYYLVSHMKEVGRPEFEKLDRWEEIEQVWTASLPLFSLKALSSGSTDSAREPIIRIQPTQRYTPATTLTTYEMVNGVAAVKLVYSGRAVNPFFGLSGDTPYIAVRRVLGVDAGTPRYDPNVDNVEYLPLEVFTNPSPRSLDEPDEIPSINTSSPTTETETETETATETEFVLWDGIRTTGFSDTDQRPAVQYYTLVWTEDTRFLRVAMVLPSPDQSLRLGEAERYVGQPLYAGVSAPTESSYVPVDRPTEVKYDPTDRRMVPPAVGSLRGDLLRRALNDFWRLYPRWTSFTRSIDIEITYRGRIVRMLSPPFEAGFELQNGVQTILYDTFPGLPGKAGRPAGIWNPQSLNQIVDSVPRSSTNQEMTVDAVDSLVSLVRELYQNRHHGSPGHLPENASIVLPDQPLTRVTYDKKARRVQDRYMRYSRESLRRTIDGRTRYPQRVSMISSNALLGTMQRALECHLTQRNIQRMVVASQDPRKNPGQALTMVAGCLMKLYRETLESGISPTFWGFDENLTPEDVLQDVSEAGSGSGLTWDQTQGLMSEQRDSVDQGVRDTYRLFVESLGGILLNRGNTLWTDEIRVGPLMLVTAVDGLFGFLAGNTLTIRGLVDSRRAAALLSGAGRADGDGDDRDDRIKRRLRELDRAISAERTRLLGISVDFFQASDRLVTQNLLRFFLRELNNTNRPLYGYPVFRTPSVVVPDHLTVAIRCWWDGVLRNNEHLGYVSDQRTAFGDVAAIVSGNRLRDLGCVDRDHDVLYHDATWERRLNHVADRHGPIDQVRLGTIEYGMYVDRAFYALVDGVPRERRYIVRGEPPEIENNWTGYRDLEGNGETYVRIQDQVRTETQELSLVRLTSLTPRTPVRGVGLEDAIGKGQPATLAQERQMRMWLLMNARMGDGDAHLVDAMNPTVPTPTSFPRTHPRARPGVWADTAFDDMVRGRLYWASDDQATKEELYVATRRLLRMFPGTPQHSIVRNQLLSSLTNYISLRPDRLTETSVSRMQLLKTMDRLKVSSVITYDTTLKPLDFTHAAFTEVFFKKRADGLSRLRPAEFWAKGGFDQPNTAQITTDRVSEYDCYMKLEVVITGQRGTASALPRRYFFDASPRWDVFHDHQLPRDVPHRVVETNDNHTIAGLRRSEQVVVDFNRLGAASTDPTNESVAFPFPANDAFSANYAISTTDWTSFRMDGTPVSQPAGFYEGSDSLFDKNGLLRYTWRVAQVETFRRWNEVSLLCLANGWWSGAAAPSPGSGSPQDLASLEIRRKRLVRVAAENDCPYAFDSPPDPGTAEWELAAGSAERGWFARERLRFDLSSENSTGALKYLKIAGEVPRFLVGQDHATIGTTATAVILLRNWRDATKSTSYMGITFTLPITYLLPSAVHAFQHATPKRVANALVARFVSLGLVESYEATCIVNPWTHFNQPIVSWVMHTLPNSMAVSNVDSVVSDAVKSIADYRERYWSLRASLADSRWVAGSTAAFVPPTRTGSGGSWRSSSVSLDRGALSVAFPTSTTALRLRILGAWELVVDPTRVRLVARSRTLAVLPRTARGPQQWESVLLSGKSGVVVLVQSKRPTPDVDAAPDDRASEADIDSVCRAFGPIVVSGEAVLMFERPHQGQGRASRETNLRQSRNAFETHSVVNDTVSFRVEAPAAAPPGRIRDHPQLPQQKRPQQTRSTSDGPNTRFSWCAGACS